jgi:hypothetical protein
MHVKGTMAVGVEFVDEAALWSWQIRGAASARVVENSWPNEWMGYVTREQACAAGLTRLYELEGRRDDEGLAERLEECQLQHTSREVLGSAG